MKKYNKSEYLNTNKNKQNIIVNNYYKNKDPAFQTNKTLKKYIYDKLKISNFNDVNTNKKENIFRNLNIKNKKNNTIDEDLININNNIKNIKIMVEKNHGQRKIYKQFSQINTPKNKNFIYYKKNSNILSYLKSEEIYKDKNNNKKIGFNKSCFSDYDSISSTYNDFSYNTYSINNNININNNYSTKYLIKPKYSNNTLFSNTINYNDLNTYNDNNKIQTLKIMPQSNTISGERIRYSLSPKVPLPYNKAEIIVNKNESKLNKNKIKNNFKIKNKLIKKSKDEKNYNINNEEKYGNDIKEIKENINKIKELEGENRYLKKMIKLSEDKLIMRENQLEKILMEQNQLEERICPTPMNLEVHISEINKKREIFDKILKNNIYNNQNNIKVNKQNFFKPKKVHDYMEEPLEQIAPKPYLLY